VPQRIDSSVVTQPIRRFALAALVLAGLAVLAPSAGASTGGAMFVATPKVVKVKCVSACVSKGRLRSGSRLSLQGKGLKAVSRVLFLGARGKRDDVEVAATATSDRRISVTVPFSAQSGPIAAAAGERRSKATKPLTIVPPLEPIPSAQLTPVSGPRDPGAPLVDTATNRAKFYRGVRGGIQFSYRVNDSSGVSVSITLVRAGDGAAVETWNPPAGAAGEVKTVSWNGLQAGQPAPEGRYAFQLVARSPSGAQARSASSSAQRDTFDLYNHVFPVRGKHNFGQSGARFGAGRAGHTHQGHDVMAACGTRLVAARGGRVQFKQFQSNAGYYIVIDGADTDVDYAYMHLAAPSPLSQGERVYTGQQIGVVGDTGDATACHLHFEMWSGPGWYDGGQPFDPLADLLAWDRYS
jgi:murein DD-endopeptidase MepM/ murein hydrolase activator NlpD